jgi:hypothetical protein
MIMCFLLVQLGPICKAIAKPDLLVVDHPLLSTVSSRPITESLVMQDFLKVWERKEADICPPRNEFLYQKIKSTKRGPGKQTYGPDFPKGSIVLTSIFELDTAEDVSHWPEKRLKMMFANGSENCEASNMASGTLFNCNNMYPLHVPGFYGEQANQERKRKTKNSGVSCWKGMTMLTRLHLYQS